MIDLLVVGDSPGYKEPLIDLYGKREMIFLVQTKDPPLHGLGKSAR